jgi:hypothetical protein
LKDGNLLGRKTQQFELINWICPGIPPRLEPWIIKIQPPIEARIRGRSIISLILMQAILLF